MPDGLQSDLQLERILTGRSLQREIRLYTHVAGNSITLPSFFSNRFRDNRHLLQSIGAIFIVIFFIPYTLPDSQPVENFSPAFLE